MPGASSPARAINWSVDDGVWDVAVGICTAPVPGITGIDDDDDELCEAVVKAQRVAFCAAPGPWSVAGKRMVFARPKPRPATGSPKERKVAPATPGVASFCWTSGDWDW